MKIGVPGETAPGERRVALVPETVAQLYWDGNTRLPPDLSQYLDDSLKREVIDQQLLR